MPHLRKRARRRRPLKAFAQARSFAACDPPYFGSKREARAMYARPHAAAKGDGFYCPIAAVTRADCLRASATASSSVTADPSTRTEAVLFAVRHVTT